MKNMLIILTILCAVTVCSKPSAGDADPADCIGTGKSFANDVKPVIELACGACQGRGSTNGPGKLGSYSRIFNARNVIRATVISGNAAGRKSYSGTEECEYLLDRQRGTQQLEKSILMIYEFNLTKGISCSSQVSLLQPVIRCFPYFRIPWVSFEKEGIWN